MIAGTWMEIVNCQIRRLDSQVFLKFERETTRWVYVVWRAVDKITNDLQA